MFHYGHRLCVALTVALLALTAIGLGHARGLVLAQGAVVLCSGDHLITVPSGERGGHDRTVVCPDMATGLLAALAVPPPAIAAPARVWRAADLQPKVLLSSAPLPLPRARGPPRRFVSA